MKCCALAGPRRLSEYAPPSDAGFLLIEAVVAVALVAVCAGAAFAAVVAVTHSAAHALSQSALTLSAQNVLTDLRAATAYDPVELAALAGKSTMFDASEPGPDGSNRIVHIVATVTRSEATNAYVASVSARAADGTIATVGSTLVQEAPAPGSVLPASTPAPASNPAIAPAAVDSSDTIPL